MQPNNQTGQPQYCPNCGASRASGANFCTNCGQQFDANDNPNPAVADQEPAFEYQDRRRHSEVTRQRQQTETGQSEDVVEFRNLHPRARWLFCISYMGRTAILPLLLLVAAGGFLYVGHATYALIAAGALGAYFVLHIIASIIAYRHYSFQVTESAFRKRYGILHIQTASIPFERIQNVNIKRGVLDRIIGLAHVDIQTAGTAGYQKRGIIGGSSSSSEGHIPGISPEEAEDVRALIMRRAQQLNGRANANNL